ncbi:IS1182 family transposase [Desulfotomaculum sp. 1211_IL3151]|uniref:IS1182 family transposase n=1 Tax=Desulfotomaculum sp. 1211_IL3151 TaxID=3084055 RepID=UPI002FDA9B38
MGYLKGTNREQCGLWVLEDMVDGESMARVIDRYIEVLNLRQLGFTRTIPADTGRPAYPPQALCKLYVYGYENGIRSSRKLEREARRNVEVMWLLEGLTPDYKTISEFRRENVRPLQKLFQEFVRLCKSWELVGGELIAVDGTKIKASNNKKMNFSRKKLTERLTRLDEKIAEYMTEAEAADHLEEPNSGAAPAGLAELLSRKERYEGYLAQMDETCCNEVSAVDPDARLMGNNRGGVDMAYNIQSAVDGKHDLVLDYHVSQSPADQNQLGYMVKRVKKLGYKRFTVVADKGYYNGRDLTKVKRYKIKAVVSRQKAPNKKDQPEELHSDKFQYDTAQDIYLCPMGQTLYSHSKKSAKRRNYFNKTACADCPQKSTCTKGKRSYRTITRSQYSRIYEEADRNFADNLALYKLRQQMVEHPFGTVKHALDGGYFLLRTRRKVRSEVALLFLGYNLKRVVKVLGFRGIMDSLKAVARGAFCVLSHLRKFLIKSLYSVLNAA